MDEQDKLKILRGAAPSYAEVEDDGAPFLCVECGKEGPGSEMYLTCIPLNGKVAMMHKTCVDQDWLDQAIRMGWKI